ncbi:MAG: hypothetical protein ACRC6V_14760 [Bacteroidales bacterium]
MLRILLISLLTIISTLSFQSKAVNVYGSTSVVYSNDGWFFDDVEGNGYDVTPDTPGYMPVAPIEDGYLALVIMGFAYAIYKRRKTKRALEA